MVFVRARARAGPGAPGWAAKSGTPAALLKSGTTKTVARVTTTAASLPKTFSARLAGTVTQTAGANGLVDGLYSAANFEFKVWQRLYLF